MKFVTSRREKNKASFLQRGLSLIELMVGIAIGMLVVVAAIGTLSFTQLSTTVVSDSTLLQQNADSIFRGIAFQATQAGAVRLDTSNDPGKVVFSSAFTGFNPSTTGASTSQIFAVHGVDGGTTGSDTLRLSYEDDGGIRDCQGNQSGTTNRVDNEFTLNNGSLMCKGASTSATAQPIADNIEDFQVWYGSQTGAGATLQTQYLTATNVIDWSNLQAIRICIVMRGDRPGNPQPGLSQNGCRGQAITTDGYIRRVYWRTFALRNKTL